MHKNLKAVGVYISRWKIESDEEKELANLADSSLFGRRKYCDFYQKADSEYYTKGVALAKNVIKNWGGVDGLSEENLVEDMIYCLHRFGFSYDEYFWFKLYNLSTYGREGFISDKMRFEYYIELNTKAGMDLLTNKFLAYKRFEKFYKRECCALYGLEDKQEYISFVSQHPSFFYKPIGAGCGHNCWKINANQTTFEDLIKDGPFIIEELIHQSGDFAEFYPCAVNIIRIPILTTKDGIPHLMGPFLTIGRNRVQAVNGSLGGINATIDPNSGVVVGNGWLEHSGEEFFCHPETKKRINGYQIPDWNKAVDIVIEASRKVPECKYIGFDLAQTKEGWIIVEANGRGQFLGQRNTDGLRRNILRYLDEI